MTFLLPLIALAVGIMTGFIIPGRLWGIIPVFSALGYYFFRIKKRSPDPHTELRNNWKHSIWIFLLFLGIGMLDSAINRPTTFTPNQINNLSKVKGEIESVSYLTKGDCFIVKVIEIISNKGESHRVNHLKLLVRTDGVSLNTGEIIIFPVKLKKIKDNPNFRPSGYASQMAKKGVLYSTEVNSDSLTIVGAAGGLYNFAGRWRDEIIIHIERSNLNRNTIDFLTAFLLGDRTFIDSEIHSTFNGAGMAHILALSGMHIAVVTAFLLFILLPLNFVGMNNLRFLISIILIWAFALLSGFSPSTVRACIMTTFFLLAIMLQRKNKALNALFASAFIILLFDPYSIYNIGMQLSFLCVAAILTFASGFNKVDHRHHPILFKIVAAILVSLIAVMGTWIVTAYYFHTIPTLFLPANLILLPVLPIIMIFSFLYIIILLMGIDISFLASILNKMCDFFFKSIKYLSFSGNGALETEIPLISVYTWLAAITLFGIFVNYDEIIKKNISSGKVIAKKYFLYPAIILSIASIIMIPVYNTTRRDAFIVQQRYNEISLTCYDGTKARVITLPRKTFSATTYKNYTIYLLDCDVKRELIEIIDSSEEKAKEKKNNRCLIIGSGYKGDIFSELKAIDTFKWVILHSSLSRKEENKIMRRAKESKTDNFYSLRERGPLFIEL